MAITTSYAGAISNTVSSAEWSASLSSGASAGDVVFFWLVTNNLATADGPSNTHTGLTGSGLTWTKLAETTASSGAADDGITASLWMSSPLPSAIGNLSFTATFSAPVSIKLAQGRSVGGSNIGVDAVATRTNYNLTAYGSMTLSGLPSKERMWLRVSGGEYGASTNATATAGFTVGTGTNTGSATSGALARHEFKIATSSGETSEFTQNVALDSASIFIALSEDGGGGGGTVPTGTVTIGTITPSTTSASVPYSYSAGDATGFESRLNGGAAASIGASPATISGLTASTPYSIEIRAINATGAGAWSAVANFTTEAEGPGNLPPSFDGPSIAAISATEGVALSSLDVSSRFSDAESALTFSAVGSWPAGVTVSSAGVISGTPTTAGTYSGLQVRATDAGALTADSNTFSITVAAAALPSTITVTDPLKNNTGTVLASQSGVRVAVLQAADLVSVFETSGLTTNASGILATISDAAIVTGQQYHVVIKLADGSVGITGPITAS